MSVTFRSSILHCSAADFNKGRPSNNHQTIQQARRPRIYIIAESKSPWDQRPRILSPHLLAQLPWGTGNATFMACNYHHSGQSSYVGMFLLIPIKQPLAPIALSVNTWRLLRSNGKLKELIQKVPNSNHKAWKSSPTCAEMWEIITQPIINLFIFLPSSLSYTT